MIHQGLIEVHLENVPDQAGGAISNFFFFGVGVTLPVILRMLWNNILGG